MPFGRTSFLTDRTVDDHIYRLRKKLSSFQDIGTIRTIKGLGYRLELKEPVEETPTPVPEEIEKQANELFDTYYKYGQGKALRELLTNKVLGLALNENKKRCCCGFLVILGHCWIDFPIQAMRSFHYYFMVLLNPTQKK